MSKKKSHRIDQSNYPGLRGIPNTFKQELLCSKMFKYVLLNKVKKEMSSRAITSYLWQNHLKKK